MSLTREWKIHVEMWKDKIPDFFYTELGEIQWEGFVSKDLLVYEEAVKRDFVLMTVGTKWGAKWEYGWFRGHVTVPEQAKGKMFVLKVDMGGESAIYINGKNAGARDRHHTEITLSHNGKPGENYEIVIESYAGHGPLVCRTGPVEPGRVTVPEPPNKQAVIGKSTYGIWNKEIYQLWLDIETLYQVRECIDSESLRVAEIDEALRKFTLTLDFELPFEQMLETAIKCRKDIKSLLECVNGSTVPEMFVFGHSHIDVAWLWPLAETERKCSRTFATQLKFIEEYPEYKFLQSQPHLYRMVKEKYPELYSRIKEAVAKGQFIPDGGMWVEPDTNIAGGEALIRQFIHGKRFYKEEFGIDSTMCWLPDVFGYTGAFPQIMKGCGVDYFSTQKIFWNYSGFEQFPYNTFWWQGIDGTRVLAHIHDDYNAIPRPEVIIKRWDQRVQKDGISTRLFPFGRGDGGGGPERDHLEFLRRIKNLEGVPKTRMCSPVEFFKDLEKRGVPDVVYVGELYFQEHRGTYTSQAKTKKGNRKCEFALREAELWSTIASRLNGFQFNNSVLDEDWKVVLLNQFHDILPGTSIKRVYEEAEAAYNEVLEHTERLAQDAAVSFTKETDALTVFNSLSWDSVKLVKLPGHFKGVMDASGNPLTIQETGDGNYIEVNVPSCGWITVYPSEAREEIEDFVYVDKQTLENRYIRVKFDECGEITSIYDKENSRELASGSCNVFKMYKDVPNGWDAWDINSMYKDTPVELEKGASIEIAERGSLFSAIRVTKTLNNSKLTQEIILRKNSRRLDFKTKVDWQEKHKLLKVCFPVNIYANEALHEIQFGYLKRPNHYSRNVDKARFEVSNHRWTALTEQNHGFAVLNDSKYGINVFENSINLTLLKSALAPDMYADRGIQEFTYSIYLWEGSFVDSDIIREGYELNRNYITVPGDAGTGSAFRVDRSNIVIDTVKPAEDGSGDVIIHMYESMHMSVKCTLAAKILFESVVQTNMLEEYERDVVTDKQDIELEFRPFEIKTIRLRCKPAI